ncbi:MAG: hypothetical protein KR126chlam2_00738, partial [Chlamydiae bacterium]|nr:hypothetical protein [Chlamydiota bacterium]
MVSTLSPLLENLGGHTIIHLAEGPAQALVVGSAWKVGEALLDLFRKSGSIALENGADPFRKKGRGGAERGKVVVYKSLQKRFGIFQEGFFYPSILAEDKWRGPEAVEHQKEGPTSDDAAEIFFLIDQKPCWCHSLNGACQSDFSPIIERELKRRQLEDLREDPESKAALAFLDELEPSQQEFDKALEAY